jgi:hypothetical protein
MQLLLRKVESPQIDIAARFPGYTVVGPKSGWFYPVPETQTVLVAPSFGTLAKNVAAHLKSNGVPTPAKLGSVIEDWWCANVDDTDCEEDDGRHARAIAVDTAARRFLDFCANWIAQGGGLVEQAEANRRAAICAACPLNQRLKACGNCFWRNLLKGTFALLSRRSTPQDEKLLQCGACSCELRLKVHFPKEAMQDPDVEWATGCWMLPDPS